LTASIREQEDGLGLPRQPFASSNATIVLLLVFTSVSGFAASSTTAPATTLSTAPVTIRDDDSGVQITLPPEWEKLPLRDEGLQIHAGYQRLQLSLGLRSFAKEDLADLSLEDMDQRATQNFQARFVRSDVSEPRAIEVNFKKALQREYRIEQDGERWMYLFTTIETESKFICIWCCAQPSRFSKSRARFDEIIRSIRELEK